MANSYEQAYSLRMGDFDRHGRLLPSTILDVLQDVATLQVESMGMGNADMIKRGVFWAVTRYKFRMLADPALHSTVIAKTWPHSPSRFSFLRDYTMHSESGELLVAATSEWVFMDVETRKFASVLDYYDNPIELLPDRCFEQKPKKIVQLPDAELEPVRITTTYADVDMNGHVNNARYADFALAAVDPADGARLGSFQLDFRQEVREGQALDVRAATIDGATVVSGCDEDGKVMFACRMEAR